jgi:release factor glutamine methyltransferase
MSFDQTVTAKLSVAEAVREAAASLRAAGIDNPRLEARLLIAHALRSPVADLLQDPTRAVGADEWRGLVARRAGHEPLAYILGHREFWSLDFRVSPATLIPRPDSETIVEAALAAFPDRPAPIRVLDLGTGTGCLLLSFLHERPSAVGIGVDRSPEAAALAAANAASLGLAGRAAFVCADWDSALRGQFDVILSNPPYVTSSAIERLMPEVAAFEPRSALDGGPDGADAYRHIIASLPIRLEAGGVAILELGAGQAELVTAIAEDFGLQASLRKDLSGTPRAIQLRNAEP